MVYLDFGVYNANPTKNHHILTPSLYIIKFAKQTFWVKVKGTGRLCAKTMPPVVISIFKNKILT